MTVEWVTESIRTEYEDFEEMISIQCDHLEYNTGLKSKAMFERMFRQEATLDRDSPKILEKIIPIWTTYLSERDRATGQLVEAGTLATMIGIVRARCCQRT